MTDEKKIKDEELVNVTGAGIADVDVNRKPEPGGGGSGGTATTEEGGNEHPGQIEGN